MENRQNNISRSAIPSAQLTLLTAEDLLKQEDDGYRYELVKGVIRRTSMAGFEHGVLSAKIGSLLRILSFYVVKISLMVGM